jgi:5-methyltetrahydrofolate--homocysteine methyltransferase
MVKALADRFAEAFAEYLHEKYVRNLGYSADEVLTAEGMIAEEYKGTVLLPGYPPVLTI